jgi:hypothetical protein
MLPTSRRILRARDDLAARGRDRGQALALAREELHPELGFELLQLLTDTGLARVKALGRRGDVQAAIGDSDEVLQLFQRHAAAFP